MKQILVIDDESQIRRLLKKTLTRECFDVLIASNGNEGMKLLSDNSVDLVITDIIMPEKEGLETIREILKVNPDLPIIAMSGGGKNSPEGYLQMAQAFGAHATLEKPVAIEDLLFTVNKALNNQSDL